MDRCIYERDETDSSVSLIFSTKLGGMNFLIEKIGMIQYDKTLTKKKSSASALSNVLTHNFFNFSLSTKKFSMFCRGDSEL